MKLPYLYCGNIGTKCPEKMPDGRCKLTEKLDTHERCPNSVIVETPEHDFVIRYLYSIRNNVPRLVTINSQPMRTYPDNLYCGKLDDHCPHQTPDGKCKRLENIPDYGPCKDELYLSPEMELITRLLQYAHRDKQKHK